jgi:hypothetical protein
VRIHKGKGRLRNRGTDNIKMCFKGTEYEEKANPINSKMNCRTFIKGGNFLTT